MDFLTGWITDWLKGLFVDGIMGNLEGLFDTVNTQVGEMYWKQSMSQQRAVRQFILIKK